MLIVRSDPFRMHHIFDEQIGLVDRLFLRHERQMPNFHRRMFDEDFARLFRSMNRLNGNAFEIMTNNDELTSALLSGSSRRYASHFIDETLRDFVEEIAKTLIRFGKAYYFLHEDKEKHEYRIVPFSSRGVIRLYGSYLQWVPKHKEKQWDGEENVFPREIRILDPSKIMCFELPGAIKRILSAQNKTLALLDKYQYIASNFQSPATYENPNPTNNFDFRVWRDIQDYAFYRATKHTGWNGRKFESSKRSDFFDCHRLIRFRRNQLLLRDDILKQLSGELSRVGKCYTVKFSVEISVTDKLSKIAHLDELEEKLMREEVGFSEIIDYCYNS